MGFGEYDVRHEGTRWRILHGADDGVERFALCELQRTIQSFLPYVVEVRLAGGEMSRHELHTVLVGTPENNPHIAHLSERGLISVPRHPQGYALACAASPWNSARRLLVVAGGGPAGVLHGVEDLSARLAADAAPARFRLRRDALDRTKDFSVTEVPAIENRGVWTWGYVIYDYRRFLDHMARLRMNLLTVWNDCPPTNSREIIDYAHSRGVRVVLGFHWGWGLRGSDLSDEAFRRRIEEHVVRDYRENYRGLGADGIYFQTLTEHYRTEMGGRSVASLACELVNRTARQLYESDPDLYIQFGLHATSIRDRFADLEALDPRVVIAWENAGHIPYTFPPLVGLWGEGEKAEWLDAPETTIEYSKKLLALRGKREFALVPKGWCGIRWKDEFEHHGSFLLGERHRAFIRRRLDELQPHWDRVNREWLRGYPLAARFYREMLDGDPPAMTVTGLVEDGLFEEEIQPSVALFAETIWNPRRSDDDLLRRAMTPYYRDA